MTGERDDFLFFFLHLTFLLFRVGCIDHADGRSGRLPAVRIPTTRKTNLRMLDDLAFDIGKVEFIFRNAAGDRAADARHEPLIA